MFIFWKYVAILVVSYLAKSEHPNDVAEIVLTVIALTTKFT